MRALFAILRLLRMFKAISKGRGGRYFVNRWKFKAARKVARRL